MFGEELLRNRIGEEVKKSSGHSEFLRCVTEGSLHGDWKQEHSKCLEFLTPLLAWDVLALSVDSPRFQEIKDFLGPVLQNFKIPVDVELEAQGFYLLLHRAVLLDDHGLFEDVVRLCLPYEILREDCTSYEDSFLYQPQAEDGSEGEEEPEDSEEPERLEAEEAEEAEGEEEMVEDFQLITFDSLMKLAVEERCWRVLCTMSRLYDWAVFIKPMLAEMPPGVIALYFYHIFATYEPNACREVEDYFVRRKRDIVALALHGPPKWEELVLSIFPEGNVPPHIQRVMNNDYSLNNLWSGILQQHYYSQENGFTQDQLIEEVIDHYLLSDWSIAGLVGVALNRTDTLLLRRLVETKCQDVPSVSLSMDDNLEVADFLFQRYPPTIDQLRKLLRGTVEYGSANEEQTKIFCYYFKKNPTEMAKRFHEFVRGGPLEYYFYPIDVAFHAFHGDVLAMVMEATPREYLFDDDDPDRLGPISQAAMQANLEQLNLLKSHYGDDIFDEALVLHTVCMCNNRNEDQVLECVREFLSDYEEIDPRGNTALHYACDEGHPKVLQFLLEQPSAHKLLKCINSTGESPLMVALSGRDSKALSTIFEMLFPLVQSEFNLRAKSSDGNTAIHLAFESGAFDVMETLMKLMQPQDYLDKNNDGQIPLHRLMEVSSINEKVDAWFSMIKRVTEEGGVEQITIPDNEGNTPFLTACTLAVNCSIPVIRHWLDLIPADSIADDHFIYMLSPESRMCLSEDTEEISDACLIFVELLKRQVINEEQLQRICTPMELSLVNAEKAILSGKSGATLGKRSAEEADIVTDDSVATKKCK